MKTDITNDRELEIQVNSPTILSSDVVSVRMQFGRIDWVGWRLARGEDGLGWPTRVPQEPPYISHAK